MPGESEAGGGASTHQPESTDTPLIEPNQPEGSPLARHPQVIPQEEPFWTTMSVGDRMSGLVAIAKSKNVGVNNLDDSDLERFGYKKESGKLVQIAEGDIIPSPVIAPSERPTVTATDPSGQTSRESETTATALAEALSSTANTQIEVAEPLVDREFLNVVSGLGNMEGKIGTFLVLAAEPDRVFGRTALTERINERQGLPHNPFDRKTGRRPYDPSDRGWPNLNPEVPFGYCSESLEKVGAVVKGSVKTNRAIVPAYQVSPKGIEWKAVGGSLAEWSELYPDQSLQLALGGTNSISEKRGPSARFQFLADLITHPNEKVAIADLVGLEDFDRRFKRIPIRDLASAGVITVDSVHFDDNRTIVIDDPQYPGAKPFEDLLPTTQALYKGFQKLAEQKRHEIAVEDFVAFVAAENPDLDPVALRERVMFAIAPSTSMMPGIHTVEGNFNADHRFTVVSIAPEWREPVADLVNRIEKLSKKDPQAIADGEKAARDIAGDPDRFAKLMAKGKRFSKNVPQFDMSEWTGQIRSILTEHPSLTINQLIPFCSKLERPVSEQTLRRVMRELEKEGVVKSKLARRDPSHAKEVQFFSLTLPEEGISIDDSTVEGEENG